MNTWLLIAIFIVLVVLVLYVKSSMDKEEDEMADEVVEEVFDCSDLAMSTRKNCLIARDGVAYET
jgi:predicted acyltransferase (DUF342 family)